MVEDGPSSTPPGAPLAAPTRARVHSYDWHVDEPFEREPEGWLLTYLDMLTLLIVMLVVLLAFSDRIIGMGVPEESDEVETTLTAPGDSVLDHGAGIFDHTSTLAQTHAPQPARDPYAGLQADSFGDDVEVLFDEGGVRLRINSELLFRSAEAELSPQGVDLLTRVAALLVEMNYQVAVEGHTDDVPIMTSRFPSNWELSTARATTVVRHFVTHGVAPESLRATGYAETRPVADNARAAGRAANRRVELILEARPG